MSHAHIPLVHHPGALLLAVVVATVLFAVMGLTRSRSAPASAASSGSSGVLAVLGGAGLLVAGVWLYHQHGTTASAAAAPKPKPAPVVTHTVIEHVITKAAGSHLTGTEIVVLGVAALVVLLVLRLNHK